jgi:hypothetical protein
VSSAVVAPIDEGWKKLNDLVDALGPRELTAAGSDGWAVKDHLVHIAAWEHSLLALLDGRDRLAAMGVPNGPEETDALNAAVWSLHHEKSPQEALQYFQDTHSLLMAMLSKMGDAELNLPYNHFQPNDPREAGDNRPVIDWVRGNTYEHYAEHIDWIQALVKESSARR